jgi:CheY-like chemotaxis protein
VTSSQENRVKVSKSVRVLVVDDELPLQRIAVRILERLGHEVHASASCAEARAVLETLLVDVAIIDLGLPDGLGSDLAREIRSRYPHLGIILSSGSHALEDPEFPQLPKPYHMDQLARTIQDVIQDPR